MVNERMNDAWASFIEERLGIVLYISIICLTLVVLQAMTTAVELSKLPNSFLADCDSTGLSSTTGQLAVIPVTTRICNKPIVTAYYCFGPVEYDGTDYIVSLHPYECSGHWEPAK